MGLTSDSTPADADCDNPSPDDSTSKDGQTTSSGQPCGWAGWVTSWSPASQSCSSSLRSTELLREAGIEVLDLNQIDEIGCYVDGADEVDPGFALIKGGGGALTREKIVAQASRHFVCIVDETKYVPVLGQFPLPVEVVPMALHLVGRQLEALGGTVRERNGYITDNGNPILDVSGLQIHDPVALEETINQWPGVVTVGLFARRRPETVLLATMDGVQVLGQPAA